MNNKIININVFKNHIIKFRFNYLIVFLLFICGPYLFLQTGLHGDDYNTISYFDKKNFYEFFLIKPDSQGIWFFVLPAYYIFYFFYFIIGFEHLYIYDLLKYILHLCSVYFVFKFFNDFINKEISLLAALFFIFSVSHDSTTYWFMASTYMIFFPSLIMYSFHLIKNNSLLLGSFLLFIGGFCYSSPPFVFGLSIFFLLSKSYKKFIIFLFIGLLFLIYYFIITWQFPFLEARINDDINIIIFSKNLLIQLFSSIDAIIGPAFLLKIYYSIINIDIFSFILCLILCFLVFLNFKKNQKFQVKYIFLLSLIFIYFLSLIMFALTGMYTQTAFNLGNRVTVYSSLLFSYLIFLPNLRITTFVTFCLIFILPVFGTSSHWKEWNIKQQEMYANILQNNYLKELKNEEILIIQDNTYSLFGPFSHIELFSMDWTLENWFKRITKANDIMAITNYVYIENNRLIDLKSKKQILLDKKIFIYNTTNNTLNEISIFELKKLIKSQSKEVRHWVQLINSENILAKSIISLSPRLKYLFNSNH